MPGTAFDSLFVEYGQRFSVSPLLLEAVALTESSLNPHASSPDGSVGLFQVIPSTARAMGFNGDYRREMSNPAVSTRYGAEWIRRVMDAQGDKGRVMPSNLAEFYSEYNSGRKSLWETSSEVFANVQRFLSHWAAVAAASGPDIGAMLLLLAALGLLVRYLQPRGLKA